MATKEKRPQPPRLCARGHHSIESDPQLAKIPGIVDGVLASLEDEESADHIGFAMIPSPASIETIIDLYMTIMMPGYFGNQNVDRSNARFYLGDKINRLYTLLQEQIRKCLTHECREPKIQCNECESNAAAETIRFLEKIPQLRRTLARDVKAAYAGDPAARSLEEIIFCYPSVRIVTIHRFAHELHRQAVPIIPRMLSEHAHALTGCDIHPGAEIGVPFFIDHGTGVVIGETTVIGDNVRIYQGVTLGGSGFAKDETGQLIRDTKRHPTIEDGCVIYAGATILGGDTVVGRDSIIGGNVWLTRSVPPGTKVVARTQESSIKQTEGKQG